MTTADLPTPAGPLFRVCYHCGYPTPGRHASSCRDADSGVVEVAKHTPPVEVAALRAEVKRLSAALEFANHDAGAHRWLHQQVEAERDAARAEVERLRPILRNLEAHYHANEAAIRRADAQQRIAQDVAAALIAAEAERDEALGELKKTKGARLLSVLFGHHENAPRPFALQRADRSLVALGAEFPDGAVALRRANGRGWTTYSEGGASGIAFDGMEVLWLSDELEPLAETEAKLESAEAERDALAARLAEAHTWQGLMALVDEHYPTSIFPVEPEVEDRDSGPRILSLLRHLDALAARLERAERLVEAAEAWRDAATPVWTDDTPDRLRTTELALDAAVDAHRSATTPGPRRWSLPPEPGLEVTRVLDTYGQYFERQHDEHPGDDVWIGQTFAGDADVPDLELEWPMLMAYQSPLTDATPDRPATTDAEPAPGGGQ